MANEQKKDSKPGKSVPGYRITAKRDGFRRAGRAWHGVSDVPADQLTDAQIKALRAEPMLTVEDVEVAAAPAAAE